MEGSGKNCLTSNAPAKAAATAATAKTKNTSGTNTPSWKTDSANAKKKSKKPSNRAKKKCTKPTTALSTTTRHTANGGAKANSAMAAAILKAKYRAATPRHIADTATAGMPAKTTTNSTKKTARWATACWPPKTATMSKWANRVPTTRRKSFPKSKKPAVSAAGSPCWP